MNVAGVRIAGIAACVPEGEVDNVASLKSAYGDKADAIVKATGILKRRVAHEGVHVVDLCVGAAARVMADCGVSAGDIGAVVGVSFTADRMPCVACQAQARLRLPQSIVAFDLMMGCSGWGYGLYLAGQLARETGRKVLLLDGDVQNAFADPQDAATLPLFSDGGTATLVEPLADAASAPAWRFAFASDGASGAALSLESGGSIRMDGFAVYRFVAVEVSKRLKEFMAEEGVSPDSVEAFVPHQANVFLVRQLAKAIGISEDRLWVSADRLGNLSSASVPATLAYIGLSRALPRQVLFSGFGGGLSFSAGLFGLDAGCRLAFLTLPACGDCP